MGNENDVIPEVNDTIEYLDCTCSGEMLRSCSARLRSGDTLGSLSNHIRIGLVTELGYNYANVNGETVRFYQISKVFEKYKPEPFKDKYENIISLDF